MAHAAVEDRPGTKRSAGARCVRSRDGCRWARARPGGQAPGRRGALPRSCSGAPRARPGAGRGPDGGGDPRGDRRGHRVDHAGGLRRGVAAPAARRRGGRRQHALLPARARRPPGRDEGRVADGEAAEGADRSGQGADPAPGHDARRPSRETSPASTSRSSWSDGREVKATFVQNERTPLRAEDGRLAARNVYVFPLEGLPTNGAVTLVVKGAPPEQKEVLRATLDLGKFR